LHLLVDAHAHCVTVHIVQQCTQYTSRSSAHCSIVHNIMHKLAVILVRSDNVSMSQHHAHVSINDFVQKFKTKENVITVLRQSIYS
jgi:hypothetical protein